jgi:hypothetical protein
MDSGIPKNMARSHRPGFMPRQYAWKRPDNSVRSNHFFRAVHPYVKKSARCHGHRQHPPVVAGMG